MGYVNLMETAGRMGERAKFSYYLDNFILSLKSCLLKRMITEEWRCTCGECEYDKHFVREMKKEIIKKKKEVEGWWRSLAVGGEIIKSNNVVYV